MEEERGGGGGPRRMGSLSYITSFYFSEAATQNSAKCAPGTVLINTRLKFVSFGMRSYTHAIKQHAVAYIHKYQCRL